MTTTFSALETLAVYALCLLSAGGICVPVWEEIDRTLLTPWSRRHHGNVTMWGAAADQASTSQNSGRHSASRGVSVWRIECVILTLSVARLEIQCEGYGILNSKFCWNWRPGVSLWLCVVQGWVSSAESLNIGRISMKLCEGTQSLASHPLLSLSDPKCSKQGSKQDLNFPHFFSPTRWAYCTKTRRGNIF